MVFFRRRDRENFLCAMFLDLLWYIQRSVLSLVFTTAWKDNYAAVNTYL